MKEALKGPIKAAISTAFVVGVLVFLLNPPSMSGAARLGVTIVGAVVIVLLTAFATVSLTGRDSLSEEEAERQIQRAEELARRPPPETEPSYFDELVSDAMDRLPAEFRQVLERVPVVISYLGAEHHAYGHYFGGTVVRDNYAHRIVLYRDTLERDFGHDPDLLEAQVERTLRHELAHHLGWHEQGVRELGL